MNFRFALLDGSPRLIEEARMHLGPAALDAAIRLLDFSGVDSSRERWRCG